MKELPRRTRIELPYSGTGPRQYVDSPEWSEYKKNIILYLHETNPDVIEQIKKNLVEHNEPQYEIKSLIFGVTGYTRPLLGASIDWINLPKK